MCRLKLQIKSIKCRAGSAFSEPKYFEYETLPNSARTGALLHRDRRARPPHLHNGSRRGCERYLDRRWCSGWELAERRHWGGTAPVANDLLNFAGAVQLLTTNNFPAGTIFNGLLFDGTADPFVLFGNSLTLTTFTNGTDGSSVNPIGGCVTNASLNIETIQLPLALSAGRHTFATAGGGQLNLNGPVSRSIGATAVFAPVAGNINVTGGLNTNGLNNILGAWATLGGDWATLDENSNVVAYTGYTDISSGMIVSDASSNVRFTADTANITAAAGTLINSLLTQQGTARSLTITNQLRLGPKGGIYRLGSGVMTIMGGSIVANGGGELTFSDSPFNATGGNNLAIASVISNDTANAVSVNIMGYVQFSQAAANSYSGGTFINQGRVQSGRTDNFGTGPIFVFPSGQVFFSVNGTWTNSFFLGGVGTAESTGLGALRMGGSGRILSGPVTLMGDAVIANNGTISGPIIGPGSLFIGHGTSANGHGVILVGGSVPNSYSGDTIIGSASQAADTLQMNSSFSNIMPHGAGKGNVVLNGGAAAITATLDLNGTTQTINGLTNTAVNPANDLVTSLAGATLILGDNNASSTFGGRIQNAIAVTKTGNGTQTFTGANTYTNGTTVNGGTLVFAAGSFPPATATVTVNTSGRLDVSDVSPLTLNGSQSLIMSNGTVVVSLQDGGNAITTPALTANGTSNFVTIAAIRPSRPTRRNSGRSSTRR